MPLPNAARSGGMGQAVASLASFLHHVPHMLLEQNQGLFSEALTHTRLSCTSQRGLQHEEGVPVILHQQNPWVLLSPPETSRALGALGALRQTLAPPGTRDANMSPPEGSGESRRALESPRGELWRAQESPGAPRKGQEGQGGPGDRLKLKKKVYHQF